MSTEATEAARKYDTEEKRRDIASHYHGGLDLERSYASALADHAAPLEAEVAKLRALVQKILDLSFHDSECHITEFGGPCDCLKSVITAAAKEQGFTPANTGAPTSEGSTTLAPTNTDGELD